MDKTRTIIIDGIEIQTSLTGVEIAGLVQRNKELEQQVKKQKEVIDKAIHLRDDFAKDNLTLIFENNELISFINNFLEILEDKEV